MGSNALWLAYLMPMINGLFVLIDYWQEAELLYNNGLKYAQLTLFIPETVDVKRFELEQYWSGNTRGT